MEKEERGTILFEKSVKHGFLVISGAGFWVSLSPPQRTLWKKNLPGKKAGHFGKRNACKPIFLDGLRFVVFRYPIALLFHMFGGFCSPRILKKGNKKLE